MNRNNATGEMEYTHSDIITALIMVRVLYYTRDTPIDQACLTSLMREVNDVIGYLHIDKADIDRMPKYPVIEAEARPLLGESEETTADNANS